MSQHSLGLAPKVVRRSLPIDLGEWLEEYTGWKVIVDLAAPLSSQDLLAIFTDSDRDLKDRNAALKEWIEVFIAEWNFVNDKGEALPQPRDGGSTQVPMMLIEPVSNAVGKAMTPKKP